VPSGISLGPEEMTIDPTSLAILQIQFFAHDLFLKAAEAFPEGNPFRFRCIITIKLGWL